MSGDTAGGDAMPNIDPEKTHVILEHAHTRPLTACCWDPQDRFVFWGAEDNGIHRFDLKSLEVTPFGVHDSWVRAIGVSPDGKVTYSGGYDGRLIWWPSDAEQPEPIHVVQAHDGWIRALAVSPDGNQIATCGNDHRVRLWDSESGTLLKTFQGHEFHVYNAAFTPQGDRLISCDLRGFVKIWDTQALTEPAKSSGPLRDLPQIEALYIYDKTFRADIGGARCMAFSNDGSRLALGGVTNVTNAFAGVGDCVVLILDVEDGNVTVAYAPSEKIRGTAWGVAHHPQDFWIGLAGGGGGGWFYFWRGDETNEFFKLKLKSDGRGLGMSPDGSKLAVAHADRHLRIYGLYESA